MARQRLAIRAEATLRLFVLLGSAHERHAPALVLDQHVLDDLAHAAEMVKKCFESKDYVEGRTAFMEKRKPVFTGT